MIDKEQDFEYEGEERTGEQGQNEFENLYNQSLISFKQGSVVKGTIAQVLAGSVMVDVGYKSDGMIPADQFTADELASLQPGDEIEVFLESGEDSHGNLRLSREKAKRMQAWDHLNSACQSGSPIKAKVLAKVKGGLSVDIGVSAFLPGSQIDMRPLRNLDQYLGKMLDVKIIKMNPGRGNIVVSRRAILEQQSASQKEETLAKLTEGQTVKGIVKNITDYGAFIDLGGIDGLLHITDMSWGRIGHPSDLLSTGQSIDVVVLKFDTERQKVSLGLKQQTEDPWLRAADRFPVNGRVRGKVVNLAEYGAFIELEPGVEGLVHVSEMSWTQKIKHPSRVVSLGDEIEVQVLSVDPPAKRISLGMKQVEPNPWQTIADRYPAGTVVEGRIKTITDFGAFVGIEEGIDGLIHVSDLSWTRHIKHPSELLKKGQTVKSVILNIDAQKERISLGLKQLDADPWEQGIPERYAMGRDETVKVVKAAEFGLFVGLEFGIEGLIPASEIPRESDGIKEGDEVTARVIKVDKGERKIALSIKALVKAQDRESVKEYLGQQDKFDTTIGALLKDRN